MSILSLEERLGLAEKEIRKPSFRQKLGLTNDVPYYVFDYDAKDELIVRDRIKAWQAKNAKGNDAFSLIVYDLYDIVIDILESKGFLNKCFEFEEKKGMERIVNALGNLLQINDEKSLIVKYIEDNTPSDAVVFLIGIGKCYPFLRSHKILNNLHQAIDTVPVVMFYPGKYTGQELILFSEIKDDNYYRAFPLVARRKALS